MAVTLREMAVTLREVAGSSPRLDGLMARHGFCDCAQNDGISFVATARRMTGGRLSCAEVARRSFGQHFQQAI